MRITVKIADVEVTIDRSNFQDYGMLTGHAQEFRSNSMKDTVIPMLSEATAKAKELYELKNSTRNDKGN